MDLGLNSAYTSYSVCWCSSSIYFVSRDKIYIIEYAKASSQEEEEVPALKPAKKPRISDSRAHQALAGYFEGMTDRENFSPLE